METKYFPDRELFKQKAKKGVLIPIVRELAADLDTPVSIFLKLGQEPPTFLLESVERGENLGRFTFPEFVCSKDNHRSYPTMATVLPYFLASFHIYILCLPCVGIRWKNFQIFKSFLFKDFRRVHFCSIPRVGRHFYYHTSSRCN